VNFLIEFIYTTTCNYFEINIGPNLIFVINDLGLIVLLCLSVRQQLR